MPPENHKKEGYWQGGPAYLVGKVVRFRFGTGLCFDAGIVRVFVPAGAEIFKFEPDEGSVWRRPSRIKAKSRLPRLLIEIDRPQSRALSDFNHRVYARRPRFRLVPYVPGRFKVIGIVLPDGAVLKQEEARP